MITASEVSKKPGAVQDDVTLSYVVALDSWLFEHGYVTQGRP